MELRFENVNAKHLVEEFGFGRFSRLSVEAGDGDDFVFSAPEDVEADCPEDFSVFDGEGVGLLRAARETGVVCARIEVAASPWLRRKLCW